ncbi:MAG: ABC transporter ATP-binding protein [Candidatus Bathyarchaeia archaeon]
MSLVKLNSISKRYGEIIALKNISLEVKAADVISIIGPSGSGKTTLLKIMAGLSDFDGTIFWDEIKIEKSNMNFLRAKSTMVFQKTIIFNTTVYKNVAYGLKLKKYSSREIDCKVKYYLEIVGLKGYEDRNARKISGGEQQRVSIARALALEPELLLLDEPTANLDPKNVSIIENVISLFNREHNAKIVMATHNLFQAEHCAKKVHVLMDGEIVSSGTPEDIFKRPNSASLATFMKYGNIFHGVSTVMDDGTAQVEIENLRLEAVTNKAGSVTVFIRPEDIVVTATPFASSMRNMYKGKILEITDLGPKVKLKIDVGVALTAIITKKSFAQMGLNLGSYVYAGFKATSVEII